MRIVFVHNNFPAQFGNLALALAGRGHQLWAIGSPTARPIPGVGLVRYALKKGTTPGIAPQAVRFEADSLRGLGAMQAAAELAKQGVTPDLIVGHCGWGETLFLKQIWPTAKQLIYAEFYVAPEGLDVGFDLEFKKADALQASRIVSKNAGTALAMTMADGAYTPTEFQRSTFPPSLRDRIQVVHDGIDTESARPRPDAVFKIPDTDLVFRAGDEVVTFVNRHLEPLRGVHSFLRALPQILTERPHAHVIIVGGQGGTAYGASPPPGRTWSEIYQEELGDTLPKSRVHFLGRVDRAAYLDILAVSAAHVYLTYPFVLSWSLLESMSAGCLVIASGTAPVREAIEHGRNGLLVDFFDVQGLARCVADALAAPETFQHLRVQARQDAIARYDLQSVCLPKLIELVEGFAT